MTPAKEILIVTGMSGAGKSTVLKTLEDLGWETVDNFPLRLLDRLLDAPLPEAASEAQPLAIGIGPRTRDFDPARIIARIGAIRERRGHDVGLLFLDCAGAELDRRYAETRRRHPLSLDRPASDGIARERELLAPLRDWANRVVDTTNMRANDLAQQVRRTFDGGAAGPVLSVMSFGFARGLPRDADMVFDMRFLRNPHWDPALKEGTGLDADVAAYVAAGPCLRRRDGADRGAADAADPALSRRGEGVCDGCDRLYGRETPVGPRRPADRGTVARGGFFAHHHPSRPCGRTAGLAGGVSGGEMSGTTPDMIGLVLVTHGRLAEEFVTAMAHVVGQQERIATICIGPEDDMEERRADIAAAIAEVEAGRGVIVLTDLFGGTPSNLAISLMERGRVEVIAGMNLPMLIRLGSARKAMKVVDAVAAAREAGRKYISVASEVLGEAAA